MKRYTHNFIFTAVLFRVGTGEQKVGGVFFLPQFGERQELPTITVRHKEENTNKRTINTVLQLLKKAQPAAVSHKKNN